MAAPAERGGLGGRAAAAGGRGVRQDMMERPGAVRPGGSGSLLGSITWSDLRGVLESSSRHYLHIRQHHGPSAEFFSCPDGEKIKVDGNCVLHTPLYRDEDSLKMLLLVNPKKRDSVLALYLNEKWWGVDEVLQSYVSAQQGLKQVQTCGERIVLFVLNCLVCGFVEGGDSENGVCFLPHSAGELAKIFWHHGEAVAFYTYKKKVCGRFLADNHKEQDRLWEVDPPGDWSQRTNIWLQIQLGETPVIKNCPAERISEHKHGKIPAIQGQGDSDRESTVPAADDTSTICSTQQLSKRKENQVEQVGDTKKSKIC
ncbi:protein FAM169B-like isoform X2 [Dendropsophus ebraccatus]|uniref:protein FAM169B-like isoform X2 n=1 Tax=Dendropsophus ebraccatus TaxID=150705 RepID=UPI0038310BC5